MWAIVVVILVAWYLWGRRRETQTRERRELRAFSYRWWFGDSGGQDWNADLVDMTVSVSVFDFNYAPSSGRKDQPLRYSLRRKDGGEWQACLTEVSRRELINELANEIRAGENYDGPAMRSHAAAQENRKAQLLELEQPPLWQPISSEVAGPLESQYQRFLRQYR